jgi:O-methyltransferase
MRTPFAKLKFATARILAGTPARGLAFTILSQLKAQHASFRGIDLVRAQIRLAQGSMVEAREMLKEELRLHPSNTTALALLESVAGTDEPARPFEDGDFAYIYGKIQSYTMVGPERLFALYQGAKFVCQTGLAGNFVECGVAGGGSSALLAWVIKEFSREPRLLYSFDTFEGMPSPGGEDSHAGKSAQATGWGAGTCAAPVESLRRIARELDVLDVVRPVKGLFQKTLPTTKQEIGAIALLHLDGDWYDSTLAILENLYGQTQPGAYLQIDDYGYWDGCRKAVEEFEARIGAKFAMDVIDATGVCFNKSES